MREAKYMILGTEEWVNNHKNDLVLKDMGPWDQYMTITNAAEKVIHELSKKRLLSPGRRVFYYDSEGDRDELIHNNGVFVRFAFGGSLKDFPEVPHQLQGE